MLKNPKIFSHWEANINYLKMLPGSAMFYAGDMLYFLIENITVNSIKSKRRYVILDLTEKDVRITQ